MTCPQTTVPSLKSVRRCRNRSVNISDESIHSHNGFPTQKYVRRSLSDSSRGGDPKLLTHSEIGLDIVGSLPDITTEATGLADHNSRRRTLRHQTAVHVRQSTKCWDASRVEGDSAWMPKIAMRCWRSTNPVESLPLPKHLRVNAELVVGASGGGTSAGTFCMIPHLWHELSAPTRMSNLSSIASILKTRSGRRLSFCEIRGCKRR